MSWKDAIVAPSLPFRQGWVGSPYGFDQGEEGSWFDLFSEEGLSFLLTSVA